MTDATLDSPPSDPASVGPSDAASTPIGEPVGQSTCPLGGPADSIGDAAVRRLIAGDFSTPFAAGNSAADACASSPARVPEAMTIGATDITDTRASAAAVCGAPATQIYVAQHVSRAQG